METILIKIFPNKNATEIQEIKNQIMHIADFTNEITSDNAKTKIMQKAVTEEDIDFLSNVQLLNAILYLVDMNCIKEEYMHEIEHIVSFKVEDLYNYINK